MSTTQITHHFSSAALDALQEKLQELKDRADSLVVTDQTSCILAKNLKLDISAYVKAVIFETGPEIETKKEELRALQSQQKMLLAPAEAILEISERKRKDWENEERRKAEEEQRRINEENQRQQRIKADEERRDAEKLAVETRKKRVTEINQHLALGKIGKREAARLLKLAGADEEAAKQNAAAQAEETAKAAPVVEVKPNIPTVAGTVSRQNWKFRITNPALIPITFRMPDEVAIGRMVRDTKDKKEAEKTCPGIEVWAD